MPLPAGVAAIFPYRPNWDRPVKQGRSFLTSIINSKNQTEQRIALRSKPRETLDYQILLDEDEAASFGYRLWGLQPYVLLLPLWPRQRRLAAAADLGTNVLLLDQPAGDETRAGDEWVLLRNGQEPEAVILDAVSGDRKTLTLVDPLADDWAINSQAYPAWQVQIDADIRCSKPTSGVVKAPLSFRRLVDARPPVSWSGVADLTVGGMEVLIRGINWAKPMQLSYDWLAMVSDNKVGPTSYEVEGERSKPTYSGEILLESRAELDWWLAFVDRQYGRQRLFLMPSWQDDLRLQSPLGPTDFEVAGTDLGTYQPEDPVHSHLMVRKLDGSLAFFTVEYVVADSGLGITSITTVEPWDEVYGPEACPQACFVHTVRLASDAFDPEWITDEVVKVRLAVTLVEDVA